MSVCAVAELKRLQKRKESEPKRHTEGPDDLTLHVKNSGITFLSVVSASLLWRKI